MATTEFNFSPSLDSDVKKELEARESAVLNTNPEWMYKKYAYFYFTSVKATENIVSSEANHLPVFAFVPDGGYRIGTTKQDGYLDTFFSNPNDIRSFNPLLKSATIKATGGGDLFDAYISEVDIQFKVFTLEQIKKVEKEFFQLGAKVDIDFGWLNRGGKANKGKLRINVYNFGFTMNNDGSYDCKLNGLTDGVLLGGQSASTLSELSLSERDALGTNSGDIASPAIALLAKCYHEFGIKDGDTSKKTIKNGKMEKTAGTALTGGIYDFYLVSMNTGTQKSAKIDTIPFITLKHLVKFIQDEIGGSQFEFMSKHIDIKVPTITLDGKTLKKETFGSADPRKYIFPGSLALYTRGAIPTNWDSITGSSLKITEILVSIEHFQKIYDKFYGNVKNKKSPPKTSDIIKGLSDDINKLSGGLVNIQVVPDVEDSGNKKISANKFKIFNNTEVQKIAPKTSSYTFKVMGPGSIVKNVSIDTDFDVDTMLATTVGRVKEGEFNIKPLQKLAPIPDIDNSKVTKRLKDMYATKTAILVNGINDTTATNLSDGFRKALTSDTSDDSTYVTLPYNLKLSVTIDGINGLGFLQPIKVDRLPSNYKAAGTRFLIIGIEHSFDGQGGWETSIDSAMKVGK